MYAFSLGRNGGIVRKDWTKAKQTPSEKSHPPQFCMSVSTLWGLSFKGLKWLLPQAACNIPLLGWFHFLALTGRCFMAVATLTSWGSPSQLMLYLYSFWQWLLSVSLKRLIDSHKLPWLPATMEEELMAPLLLLFFFFFNLQSCGHGNHSAGCGCQFGVGCNQRLYVAAF